MPRMRSLLFLPFLLAACGTTDAPSESMCLEIEDDACMNEDNLQECLDAEAECPGTVLIMESCPLQFGCA